LLKLAQRLFWDLYRKAEKIVEEIHNQGGSAEFKAVNVADKDMAFIHFARTIGRVDVIFNLQVCLYPQWMPWKLRMDTMINVNINGVLNGIAAPVYDGSARRRSVYQYCVCRSCGGAH